MASTNKTNTQSTSNLPKTASLPPTPVLSDEKCDICYAHVPNPILELTTLPCGHAFHPDCICPWIQESAHNDCPMCRRAATYTCGHPLDPALFRPGVIMSSLLLDQPCERYCPDLEAPHFHPDDIVDWLNEEGPAPQPLLDWLHGRGEMPREVLPYVYGAEIDGQRVLHPPQVPTLEWFRECVLRPMNRTPMGDLHPAIILQRRLVEFERQLTDLYRMRDSTSEAIATSVAPHLRDAFDKNRDFVFTTSETELKAQISVCSGEEGAQRRLLNLTGSELYTEFWDSVFTRVWLEAVIGGVRLAKGEFQAVHGSRRQETVALLMHALKLVNDPRTQPQHIQDLREHMSRASQMHVRREELADEVDAMLGKFEQLHRRIHLHCFRVGILMRASYDHISDVDQRALKILDLKADADERCVSGRKLRDEISNKITGEEYKKLREDVIKYGDEDFPSDGEEDLEDEDDYEFTAEVIEHAIQRLSSAHPDEEEGPEEASVTRVVEDSNPSVVEEPAGGGEYDHAVAYHIEDPMPGYVPDEYPLPDTPLYVRADDPEDDDYLIASTIYLASRAVPMTIDLSYVTPSAPPPGSEDETGDA